MRGMFQIQQFQYYRCGGCGTVTTLPYPTIKEMIKHYRTGFETKNYKAVMEHQVVYQGVLRALAKTANAYLYQQGRSLSGMKLLDIGCFTGEFLIEAKNLGADVYGVDLQPEAVRIAQSRLGDRVQIADIVHDKLVFPLHTFDIITILGLIEHVTDVTGLLERVSQLLAPGGVLMIQTPDSGSVAATIMGRLWPPFTPIEHIHLFTRFGLRSLLKRFGYHVFCFKSHVKMLTPGYIHGVFRTFAPSLFRLLRPIVAITPQRLLSIRLPVYIGEMTVFARKKDNTEIS